MADGLKVIIAMGGEVISLISLYAPNNATIRKHFYERIGIGLFQILLTTM